jgi:hypothetical protein
MKDPVRGTFRVTDCYDAHPHESNSRPRMTGVVSAPGGFLPPGGQADITLEITKNDGSFYTATTRIAFSTPERRASIATPGNRLPVRIGPANPSRVVIDMTAQR